MTAAGCGYDAVMADPRRRLASNAPGGLFVDDSCIDCGACRWIAPETFDASGGQSRVHTQPDPGQRPAALRALVSCPTASIGALKGPDVRAAAASFPYEVLPGVYHLGFHDEASFGAASWLIARPGGAWMVDVPRFSRGLADRIGALGGLEGIFLTHRDDVAGHERWAERTGARRVLHADDQTARTRSVERLVRGQAPVALAEDLLVIPTPGHTRGSACLLFTPQQGAPVLFSGDHLAWRRSQSRLVAFRGACWYDWGVQTASMQRLTAWRFGHVLPGHGAPVSLPPEELARQLAACVAWMRAR